jgi:hypothetical protein
MVTRLAMIMGALLSLWSCAPDIFCRQVPRQEAFGPPDRTASHEQLCSAEPDLAVVGGGLQGLRTTFGAAICSVLCAAPAATDCHLFFTDSAADVERAQKLQETFDSFYPNVQHRKPQPGAYAGIQGCPFADAVGPLPLVCNRWVPVTECRSQDEWDR